MIELTAPMGARVARLVRTYGESARDGAAFAAGLERLPRHIGREPRDAWRTLLHAGDLTSLARGLLETHYDPAYGRGAQKTNRRMLASVDTGDGSAESMQRAAATVRTLLADSGAGRLGRGRALGPPPP